MVVVADVVSTVTVGVDVQIVISVDVGQGGVESSMTCQHSGFGTCHDASAES